MDYKIVVNISGIYGQFKSSDSVVHDPSDGAGW